MKPRNWVYRAVLTTLVCGLLAGHVLAQSYPSRPVRIILGAGTGGNTDTVAREIASRLSTSLGQSVVVENRPGAAGNIAADRVAKSSADGYTLLVPSSVIAASPSLYSNLTFDPVKDFAPISQLVSANFGIIVPANSPGNNLTEFVAYAKTKGSSLSYPSSGAGQAAHYGMEWLKSIAGFDAVHIPYNSQVQQITAVLSGTADIAIVTLTGTVAQAQAGKLKIIATTGTRRSPLLPSVPTVMESGFRDYTLVTWVGLMAPAATPREIVRKLNQETVKALKHPETIARFRALDLDVVGSSPEQFAAYMKSEVKRIGELIKLSGAKAE